MTVQTAATECLPLEATYRFSIRLSFQRFHNTAGFFMIKAARPLIFSRSLGNVTVLKRRTRTRHEQHPRGLKQSAVPNLASECLQSDASLPLRRSQPRSPSRRLSIRQRSLPSPDSLPRRHHHLHKERAGSLRLLSFTVSTEQIAAVLPFPKSLLAIFNSLALLGGKRAARRLNSARRFIFVICS